jgi:hypothetical protein
MGSVQGNRPHPSGAGLIAVRRSASEVRGRKNYDSHPYISWHARRDRGPLSSASASQRSTRSIRRCPGHDRLRQGLAAPAWGGGADGDRAHARSCGPCLGPGRGRSVPGLCDKSDLGANQPLSHSRAARDAGAKSHPDRWRDVLRLSGSTLDSGAGGRIPGFRRGKRHVLRSRRGWAAECGQDAARNRRLYRRWSDDKALDGSPAGKDIDRPRPHRRAARLVQKGGHQAGDFHPLRLANRAGRCAPA